MPVFADCAATPWLATGADGLRGHGAADGTLAAVRGSTGRRHQAVRHGRRRHAAARRDPHRPRRASTPAPPGSAASTPGMAIPGEIKLGFLPDVCLRPGSAGDHVEERHAVLRSRLPAGARRASARASGSASAATPVKGVRFADLLPVFFDDPRTHGIVLVGEVGGTEEEECADALLQSRPAQAALCADRRARGEGGRGHGSCRRVGAWRNRHAGCQDQPPDRRRRARLRLASSH